MKEIFTIQPNASGLAHTEDRVRHFCSLCNVGNYYSVVSVAVERAVEYAMQCSDASGDIEIVLGQCHGGIYAEVCRKGASFMHVEGIAALDTDVRTDSLFIMQQLSDSMVLSDDGHGVRMQFEVAGINPADARRRAAVLQSALTAVGIHDMV